jgi:hypothetical protein
MISEVILFQVRNVSDLNLKRFLFSMNLEPYQTGPKTKSLSLSKYVVKMKKNVGMLRMIELT